MQNMTSKNMQKNDQYQSNRHNMHTSNMQFSKKYVNKYAEYDSMSSIKYAKYVNK